MLLRGLSAGHRDPEVHRRGPPALRSPCARAASRKSVALARVRGPGDARRAPRPTRRRPRRAGRTPAAPCRRSAGTARARRSSSGSPATNPERKPVIDERFESVLKATTPSRSASCSADGAAVEPQLGVRLVARRARTRARAPAPRARARNAERRDGSRSGCSGSSARASAVRRQVSGGDGVEVGRNPLRLEQRQLDDLRARERARRARAPGIRARSRRRCRGRRGVEHDLGEREDRLLRAERGDHLSVGVERDAEAAADPAGDRLAQLGEADRGAGTPSARARRRAAPGGSAGRSARAGRPSRSRSPRARARAARRPPR